jgi:hypothetical protein
MFDRTDPQIAASGLEWRSDALGYTRSAPDGFGVAGTGARVAEGSGLLSRPASNGRVGSNPTPSVSEETLSERHVVREASSPLVPGLAVPGDKTRPSSAAKRSDQRCFNEFRLPDETLTRRCELADNHEGVCGRAASARIPDPPLPPELRKDRALYARVSVVISTGARLDVRLTDDEATKVIKYITKLVKPKEADRV